MWRPPQRFTERATSDRRRIEGARPKEFPLPTHVRGERLRRDQVQPIVAAATFPRHGRRSDGVGIEAEVLPVRVGRDGATQRLPLEAAADIARAWAVRSRGVRPTGDHPALPGFALPDGTRITFEPGGQLEVSGPYMPTLEAAIRGVDGVLSDLARGFDEHGVALVAVGTDLWHPLRDVPQQLRSPRYPAMAAYLEGRSDHGARMMRQTCALQINLDLGGTRVSRERWLLANLVAPLATASFANSPALDGSRVSRRAGFWSRLDPTRTGFPRALVAGEDDPVVQMVDAALSADVMLIQVDDHAVPGAEGWTFQQWLRDGHPELGYPTRDDLRYHLTTLFHEVRPRGSLEVRSVDSLPARWRPVPILLYAGLLYDEQARQQVLDVLAPTRGRLPELLERCATAGLADAALCAAAVETWSFALEGARRLPAGTVNPADVERAEQFVDRFTMRGRCPADELRERYLDDPADARSWATEPVPTVVT